MGHQADGVADAEVDRGLAQQHRHQLSVQVGDMNQGDVADRIEAQQVLLGQTLLGESSGPAVRQKGRGRGDNLKEIAPRDHSYPAPCLRAVPAAAAHAPPEIRICAAIRRPDNTCAARCGQDTVIESSPTIFLPSSSIQVSTTGPDSWARNLN